MRALERKIGAICRAVAVRVAEGHRVTKIEALNPERPTEQGGRSLKSVCGQILVVGLNRGLSATTTDAVG